MSLIDVVCEHLPDDWQVSIHLRHGEIDIVLTDPEGNTVPMNDRVENVRNPVTTMVMKRVNYARNKDGLGKVGA